MVELGKIIMFLGITAFKHTRGQGIIEMIQANLRQVDSLKQDMESESRGLFLV
jgi:hypothetical protein